MRMVIPAEYISSICEVKTIDNVLIATGMVDEITDEYIEVAVKSGKMSTIRFGEEVKINLFNSKHGFRVLAGKVYTSSLQFIRIVEVISILDYERRHFFRVDIDMKSNICIKKRNKPKEQNPYQQQPVYQLPYQYPFQSQEEEQAAEEEDIIALNIPEDEELPEGEEFSRKYDLVPIRIKNLSISGMMFASEKQLIGKVVWVQMKMEKFNGPLPCRIKRIEDTNKKGFYYGCEFIEIPDDISNALCPFIFQKQREQINSKEGNPL